MEGGGLAETPIPLVERVVLPATVVPERAPDTGERVVDPPRPLDEACARAPRESDCVIAGLTCGVGSAEPPESGMPTGTLMGKVQVEVELSCRKVPI